MDGRPGGWACTGIVARGRGDVRVVCRTRWRGDYRGDEGARGVLSQALVQALLVLRRRWWREISEVLAVERVCVELEQTLQASSTEGFSA